MNNTEVKNRSLKNKVIQIVSWIAAFLGFAFVTMVFFEGDQIDKDLVISQHIEACNIANMKIVAAESQFSEEDIKNINETGSPLKLEDGTILTPFEAHIKSIKALPVSDCEKLKSTCEQDLSSPECIKLSAAVR